MFAGIQVTKHKAHVEWRWKKLSAPLLGLSRDYEARTNLLTVYISIDIQDTVKYTSNLMGNHLFTVIRDEVNQINPTYNTATKSC